ncbi:4'-phosphopantetheinyl transferase superfamily protein [uncultured Polaribacter sp.]|uniref:4'-phosphopantetheinyl transferase family protein n=1 Tax=uncultured Polaribacter sp. TaxID=174711 RepID=UPI00261D55FB|nr:4'-phosphopantetheinyl transferase superfamily protein [uncultured Polaribacter sp.]
MYNIGNDIVDLNVAKTQSNWQRKGFLEKQFTMYEQNEILNADNPFLKVWLFWSMKEAAYKCYMQQHKKRFFAPKKFLCKIVSTTKGNVILEDEIFYINYIISDTYIYAVATKKNDVKMVSNSFFVEKNTALTKIINTKLLSYFSEDIQLKKNRLGIPYLFKKDKKLPISISKTHHGNYGAFAFSL